MAEVVLPADELIALLDANKLIPQQVFDIQAGQADVSFRVKTGWVVPKSVRVRLRLVGFEAGQATVEIGAGRLVETFDWLVEKYLNTLLAGLPAVRCQYPRLYVDVDRLLGERIKGVRVTDITFADGQLRVVTGAHDAHQPAPTDNAQP